MPQMPPVPSTYRSRQFSDQDIEDYLRAKGIDPKEESPRKWEALSKIGEDPLVGRFGLGSPTMNFFGMMRPTPKEGRKEWERVTTVPKDQPLFDPTAWQTSEIMGENPVLGGRREDIRYPDTGAAPAEPRRQGTWDLEHPWEATEKLGPLSVMSERSLPQKVLNAFYEFGSRTLGSRTYGLMKWPHDESAVDEPLASAAGGVGRLVGEIAGPFKTARMPAQALAGAGRRAMIASDFGGPYTRQLLHSILESGTTLGLGLGLSDLSDMPGAPERMSSGFATGVGFGAAGMISSKTAPRLFGLLRQYGGRAMLALTDGYSPSELMDAVQTGEGVSEAVYHELLNTFFLRHGRNLKETLSTARTVRAEVEALGLKGFPTDAKIISNARELLSGMKPDVSSVEQLLGNIEKTQPTRPDMEKKAGHEWQEQAAREIFQRGRSEARVALGVDKPGTMRPENAPVISLEDPRIPVKGPLGPTVGLRAERPGERMTYKPAEDYWEAYAGVSMKPGATAFEKWLARQLGWKQDQMNLDTMSKLEQRGLAEEGWKRKTFEQIAKREAQGLEIGLDKDQVFKFIDDAGKLGRLLTKTPRFLQPIVSLGQAIKKNADYWWSLEMDTNCPRRFRYAATVKEIEGRLRRVRPDKPMLTSDELLGLSEMLKARGELAPCLYCYVESARRAYSEAVLGGLKEHKVDIPAEAFSSKESRQAFAAANPQLADVTTKIATKAQAASLANLSKGFSAYAGDVYKISKADWDKIDARAGLRMNSNTDFQIDQTLDYMRAIVDLAVLKKKSHAFTKVPSFAKIFAPSGVKVLQSLYAKGPGIEDAIEGMPWGEAMANRNKYKNVGTILVAKDDATLRWALQQEWIDMVIPYHRSGMTRAQMDRFDLKDYTSVQKEKWIKPEEHRRPDGKLEETPRFEYEKHGNDVETYLRLCREAGVHPRFKEFVYLPDGSINPGYMKLITDEPRMDVPQAVVKPEFDWAEARKAIRDWQAEGGYNKKPQQGIVRDVLGEIERTGEFNYQYGTRPEAAPEVPSVGPKSYGEMLATGTHGRRLQPDRPKEVEYTETPLPREWGGGHRPTELAENTSRNRVGSGSKNYGEIRDAYSEFNRRVYTEGEPRDAVIADLKSRGFSVRRMPRGGYVIDGAIATAAARRAAGEPQALPNEGSKYGYGASIDGTGSTPKSKPNYIKTEFGTLWDVVRYMFPRDTRHSLNLEKEFGKPAEEHVMAPGATSTQRAAYWVNERGQFPKTVREAVDIILKKGIPSWESDPSLSNVDTRIKLREQLEFLSKLEHIDGPLRWGADKKSDVGGTYERDTGVIWSNPTGGNAIGNIIHEVAHAATFRFANRMDRQNWDRLRKIADDTKQYAKDAHLKQYGDKDVGEYAAEYFGSPGFAERNTLLGFAANRPDVASGARLPEAIASASRAGITKDTPTLEGNVTAKLVGDHGSTQTWRMLGPGNHGIGTRVIEKRGRTNAEIEKEVIRMTRDEMLGTFMAGAHPGPEAMRAIERGLEKVGERGAIEDVRRAVSVASRATKEEVAKAEQYLYKLHTEQATPAKAPEAPGVNIGKPSRTVVQYGTTERAALEKQGVEYLSKVGKNQEKLDAYDKANNLRETVETAEPLLDASMRAYPIPRRPVEFAEVFPEGKIVREVRDAAEAVRDGRQGWFESGFRWLERVGGGPVNTMKDVFYEPIKRGLDSVQKSLKDETLRMRAIAHYLGLSTKAAGSAELMRWLTARQHGGERVLELSGLNELEAGKYRHSPPPEAVQKMMNWMDRQLLQTFHDVNRARIKAGNDPIEWRQDYFTFWHAATALNSLGTNLITSPLEVINAKMAEYGRMYEADMSTKQAEMRSKSRFSKWMFQKRTGKLGPVEMDAYGVFTKYMRAAYEQIYLAEAQSIMAKLADGTWKIDGKEWSMKEANPALRDSLSDYLGFVATGAKPGEMPRATFEVLNKLGRNVAVGKVGLNFKSTLNQISSNLHNWSYLGGKYFTEGLTDYMKAQVDGITRGWVEGGKWAEAREIGDIATRRREIAFAEFMETRPHTPWGRGWKKAGEIGMAPLQMMDMVTAEIAWRGAYKKAMEGNADGLMGVKGNHQRSVDFANSTVARTQGSTQRADITPFQRGQFGKVASVLQNFVINEWGFVTTDLMGLKSADKGNPEHVKRAVRFMIGALLVDWFYEDVLNVPSPLNIAASPMHFIRPAKKEYDKSGNLVKTAGAVLQAAGETLPIVGRGFTPYGAGGGGAASISTAQDVVKGVRKASFEDFIDAAGSLAGIPGSFAAARGMRIQKKGGGFLDQVVGSRQEEKKSTGKKTYNRETGKWETKPQSSKKKKYNRETGRWE